MSIFALDSRKQIPVPLMGTNYIVYEPSALDRCEYFRKGQEYLAKFKESSDDNSATDNSATAINNEEKAWTVFAYNRKQTAFLIAVCLKPGYPNIKFESILADVESLPDDALDTLAKAAFEVANLRLESKEGNP